MSVKRNFYTEDMDEDEIYAIETSGKVDEDEVDGEWEGDEFVSNDDVESGDDDVDENDFRHETDY